jgi:hypothetical protein
MKKQNLNLLATNEGIGDEEKKNGRQPEDRERKADNK